MHALTCLSNNSDNMEVKMFSQEYSSLLTTVATKQIKNWLKNVITSLKSKFLQKGRLENDLKEEFPPVNKNGIVLFSKGRIS